MIDFRKLAEAGVHFGHESSRWNPKMKDYIWGSKNKVHLIDLQKTARQLEKAARFLESVATQGKQILWVGTKKAAQEAISSIASSLQQPHVVHRWIGGTFTNFSQIKKMKTRLLHFEDIVANASKFPLYTKKDIGKFQKIADRLSKNVGGMRALHWPVGAIVVVDVAKEHSALKEAAQLGIPVVALVDTNGDPSLVDYVIPANDDTPKSVRIILDYLGEAVMRGKALSQQQSQTAASSEETVEEEASPEMLRLTAEEEEEAARNRARKSNARRTGFDDVKEGTRPKITSRSSSSLRQNKAK